MSDEKSKPVDDLKQGLGLLFKAAKGAVEKLPTDKIEDVVKDGAKEVGKAFESVANEIDKVFNKAVGSQPPPQGDPPPEAHAGAQASATSDEAEKKKDQPPEQPYDDAYAPEPPKGPRVG